MRVLIVESSNPWGMEVAAERALRRAGHDNLTLDHRRMKRAIETGLDVELRARGPSAKFLPDMDSRFSDWLDKCSICS